MNIDIKESDEKELMSYQIALLNIQVNVNQQLSRIKAKLEEIKKGKK